ncbi:MAG: hypothetical protein CME71_06200 [Halobacteriovorax sp.]|nr:hypothetical protein [Halobacteriovorax sp.]
MKSILALSSIFFYVSVSFATCTDTLQADIKKLSNEIHAEYLGHTKGKHGIKNFEQERTNEALFIEGDDKVIVMFHGFMASPREMLPLAKSIHQELGHSVYIPMIRGFGAVSEINDKYNFDHWRLGVSQNIALVTKCFSSIGVIGYSIGAGMLVDHLLSDKLSPKVKSVALLSPFFKGHSWQAPALGTTVSKSVLNLMRYVLRVERVKLTTVDKVVRGKYKDLQVLIDDPDTYTQSFSVISGKALMDITKALKDKDRDITSELPTFLAYSKSDQTISWRFARRYVDRHFKQVDDTFILEKDLAIPHEIVVPNSELNPTYIELYQRINAFLSRTM